MQFYNGKQGMEKSDIFSKIIDSSLIEIIYSYKSFKFRVISKYKIRAIIDLKFSMTKFGNFLSVQLVFDIFYCLKWQNFGHEM